MFKKNSSINKLLIHLKKKKIDFFKYSLQLPANLYVALIITKLIIKFLLNKNINCFFVVKWSISWSHNLYKVSDLNFYLPYSTILKGKNSDFFLSGDFLLNFWLNYSEDYSSLIINGIKVEFFLFKNSEYTFLKTFKNYYDFIFMYEFFFFNSSYFLIKFIFYYFYFEYVLSIDISNKLLSLDHKANFKYFSSKPSFFYILLDKNFNPVKPIF